MPTYIYRCPDEHTFELEHSIKDDSPRQCPQCGQTAKRVPAGGAGLLFKGSGFYITDYRSDSYQKGAKSDSGSGASGTAAPGGATSKPAPAASPPPAPKPKPSSDA